jgi:hypothetical protein
MHEELGEIGCPFDDARLELRKGAIDAGEFVLLHRIEQHRFRRGATLQIAQHAAIGGVDEHAFDHCVDQDFLRRAAGQGNLVPARAVIGAGALRIDRGRAILAESDQGHLAAQVLAADDCGVPLIDDLPRAACRVDVQVRSDLASAVDQPVAIGAFGRSAGHSVFAIADEIDLEQRGPAVIEYVVAAAIRPLELYSAEVPDELPVHRARAIIAPDRTNHRGVVAEDHLRLLAIQRHTDCALQLDFVLGEAHSQHLRGAGRDNRDTRPRPPDAAHLGIGDRRGPEHFAGAVDQHDLAHLLDPGDDRISLAIGRNRHVLDARKAAIDAERCRVGGRNHGREGSGIDDRLIADHLILARSVYGPAWRQDHQRRQDYTEMSHRPMFPPE